MKIGELVDFWGIKLEIDGAVGAGYHPCTGCDLDNSKLVPAEYCKKGRALGCAGEKYGHRLPDEMPDDAFVFTLQPCNVDEKYFAKCAPPRYWRQVLPLPQVISP